MSGEVRSIKTRYTGREKTRKTAELEKNKPKDQGLPKASPDDKSGITPYMKGSYLPV
jgi:hypothetical protein